MDSKTIYLALCESRKPNIKNYGPGSGLHRHHIIPLHDGGTDTEDNYTYLTPREHAIAHYLRWRAFRQPNDLRSMHMLGAELTTHQRRIVGRWCFENNIGFFGASEEQKAEWRSWGIESQKIDYEQTGNKQSFYYWSTEEGRKERAALGGKASIESGNNKEWLYWMSEEGRKERASLGAKAHVGKKCMFKAGDTTFKRVKPEDIEEHLLNGYVFGSPLVHWTKRVTAS